MPIGVSVEVDDGYARVTFPDERKRGPAVAALLKTGAPISVRTGGRVKAYIVPEGNAREAGLIDVTSTDVSMSATPAMTPVAVPARRRGRPAAKKSVAERVALATREDR